MATLESKAEPTSDCAASRAEIADYLNDLIQDLMQLAESARMPRVARHLKAASLEAARERDSNSLNS